MLYIIMKAVNQNKEFRMSFDENGRLGYWEQVVPCYTLFHPDTHTFTDIWSEYSDDFDTFYPKSVIRESKAISFCRRADWLSPLSKA